MKRFIRVYGSGLGSVRHPDRRTLPLKLHEVLFCNSADAKYQRHFVIKNITIVIKQGFLTFCVSFTPCQVKTL